MRTEETVREALILTLIHLEVYTTKIIPEMEVLRRYRYFSKMSDAELTSHALNLWEEMETRDSERTLKL